MTATAPVTPGRIGRWFASFALFFALWQYFGASEDVFALEPPTDVLPTLVDEIFGGALVEAVLGTLKFAGIGFVIAAAIGIPLGMLTGLSLRARWVLDPLVNAAYAAPLSMAIPIIGLYLGLAFDAKVFMVVMFAVFVIAINTAAGVRDVPDHVQEMARAFDVSPFDRLRKIILPWSSPQIITGLRLGTSRAVQGAILADLLLQADNLGLYLIEAGSTFAIEELLAGIFFITIIASSLMLLARGFERWFLRWKV